MEKPKIFDLKKQILSIALVFILLIMTVIILNSGEQSVTWAQFFGYISHLKAPIYLLAAFTCVAMSICSEACSLSYMLFKLGFRQPFRYSAVYAASDIYFSAITPSATGGQPASAFYMTKTDVSASAATATLILNVFQYTLSLLIWSIFGFIMCPGIFGQAKFTVQILLTAAVIFNVFFLALCLCCVMFPGPVRVMGNLGIALLSRLHIFKNRSQKEAAFAAYLNDYRQTSKTLLKYPSVWFVSLLFNLLQRGFMYLVPVMVYMASGGNGTKIAEVLGKQSLVALGSNSVPIPGASGVSEYLFSSVFREMFSNPALLLTRLISHYTCFIACGVFTLAFHMHLFRRRYQGPKKDFS